MYDERAEFKYGCRQVYIGLYRNERYCLLSSSRFVRTDSLVSPLAIIAVVAQDLILCFVGLSDCLLYTPKPIDGFPFSSAIIVDMI